MSATGQELAQDLLTGRHQALSPVDRFGEVIFGLIMVLTFTGSISVATSGRQEIRELLIAALGCNIAWGLVDGVMYLVAAAADRGRQARIREAVRQVDRSTSRTLVRMELPEVVDAALDDTGLDAVVDRIGRLGEGAVTSRLTWEDFKAALAVFLLVTLATLPVALPFIFLQEVQPALRTSNAIALLMLFVAGWSLGRAHGLRPWRLGIGMALLGTFLVAVTMALGG